jgi:hypothetical protein
LSGPKSYGYTVDIAALERARERRSLLDSIDRLQARHAELIAQAKRANEAYGDEIGTITPVMTIAAPQASLDQIRIVERELSERVVREETELQQQITHVTRSLVGSGLDLALDETLDNVADLLTARQPAPTEQDDDAQSEVRRLLARLDCRSPTDLETVRRTVATALSAKGSRMALALESLRVAIGAANEREAARESARLRLEQLEARLDGLDPAICMPTRETLSSAHNRELSQEALESLERVVDRTVVAAQAADERGYVADQLKHAFAELGYDVSEGFATAIVDGGYVDVAKSQDAWAGYAVRVRLPTDGERIAFNMVRGEAWRPDQAAHDAEMESAFCKDVPQIQQSLNGVELEARRLAAPGEVPVQVVDIPAPTARRHVSREQERQL